MVGVWSSLTILRVVEAVEVVVVEVMISVLNVVNRVTLLENAAFVVVPGGVGAPALGVEAPALVDAEAQVMVIMGAGGWRNCIRSLVNSVA